MSGLDEEESTPESELSADERAYLLEHSGLAAPFSAGTETYEQLRADALRQINATRMTIEAVAALLGADAAELRAAIPEPDMVGLIMRTPQAELRSPADASPMTPLEWLASGGDPEEVWELLTLDFLG